MKNINRTNIVIAVTTLATGILIGWLFFGENSNNNTSNHQHEVVSENTIWTCSMHPQIRKSEAGPCPLCGMDLIPVDTGTDDGDPQEIRMSPTAMQLASVQTSIIEKKSPIKELRLNGKVKADERYISSQTSHISGRIEKLLVNYTGEQVKKGQVIAYIYSPDLVTAQEELFEAYKIRELQPALYAAAREKLRNWKLTEAQVDGILESGVPIDNFPILSDLNGTVFTKRVNFGDHIKQGSSLFEIADLSKIWILFDLYESDIPWVKKGSEVEFEILSFPGRKFEGVISFIDPVIDPVTRVAKARVTMRNVDQKLKPEMFVNGIVKSPLKNGEKVIIVPKSAIMWTGQRSVVYIKSSSSLGIGFKMREVLLGPSLGDSYVIIEGLEEGEEVATHGTFSIDAAAQLAGKPSMMNPLGSEGQMQGHQHNNGQNTEEANHDEHSGTSKYVCSMFCEGSESEEPGKCPVCGMNLELRTELE